MSNLQSKIRPVKCWQVYYRIIAIFLLCLVTSARASSLPTQHLGPFLACGEPVQHTMAMDFVTAHILGPFVEVGAPVSDTAKRHIRTTITTGNNTLDQLDQALQNLLEDAQARLIAPPCAIKRHLTCSKSRKDLCHSIILPPELKEMQLELSTIICMMAIQSLTFKIEYLPNTTHPFIEALFKQSDFPHDFLVSTQYPKAKDTVVNVLTILKNLKTLGLEVGLAHNQDHIPILHRIVFYSQSIIPFHIPTHIHDPFLLCQQTPDVASMFFNFCQKTCAKIVRTSRINSTFMREKIPPMRWVATQSLHILSPILQQWRVCSTPKGQSVLPCTYHSQSTIAAMLYIDFLLFTSPCILHGAVVQEHTPGTHARLIYNALHVRKKYKLDTVHGMKFFGNFITILLQHNLTDSFRIHNIPGKILFAAALQEYLPIQVEEAQEPPQPFPAQKYKKERQRTIINTLRWHLYNWHHLYKPTLTPEQQTLLNELNHLSTQGLYSYALNAIFRRIQRQHPALSIPNLIPLWNTKEYTFQQIFLAPQANTIYCVLYKKSITLYLPQWSTLCAASTLTLQKSLDTYAIAHSSDKTFF